MSRPAAVRCATFATRSAPSLVRHRKDRARPRVHSEFVSALRGKDMKCPACSGTLAFEGDRWACAGCKGVFRRGRRARRDGHRDPPGAVGDARAQGRGEAIARARRAGEKMVAEKLGSPTIDRCKAHGTWFDETSWARRCSRRAPACPRASTGIRGWLRRLF